jgi:TonB family protein
MSKKRLLSSLAAVCGALVITARFATLYFPISAPAQEVVKGGDNLLHRGPIEYPADAIEKRVDGTVVVEATLNDRGVVTDARVISGPDLLRKAALKSVLDWHYNAQTQSPVEVAVDFKLPEKKPGTIIGSVPTAIPNGRLMRIQAVGISPALRDAVIGHLAIQVGDLIAPDTLDRARRAVREVDEHLDVRYSAVITNTGEKEYSLVIFATAPIVGQVTSEGPQRIRVGGNVQATMAISAPKPLYPPDAKQARIQGTVRMNVVIGKDGTVKDLQVASGHPLLVDTAADAVRQWVYKPTLLNGNPVEVVTVVDVNFTLSQ